MKMTKTSLLIAAMALLPLLSRGSNALPLFNTGVDASGDVMGGGSPDSHWSMNSSDIGSSATPVYVLSPQNMYGLWQPDDATGSFGSAWIGYTDTYGEPAPPYFFNETFSLSGRNVASASLSGTVWGDDQIALLLNGHLIVESPVNQGLDFFSGQAWSVDDSQGWFLPGLNTLSVEMVAADQVLDGVRVSVNGSAAPSAAPDAGSSLFLLGIALTGLGAARRWTGSAAR